MCVSINGGYRLTGSVGLCFMMVVVIIVVVVVIVRTGQCQPRGSVPIALSLLSVGLVRNE